MGVFLRMRHWLVFLLSFGLFVAAIIIMMIYDLGETDSMIDGDLVLRAVLLVQTICIVCANFWIFAVGTRLHEKHYYNSFMMLIFRWFVYFSTLFNAARFVMFPAIDFFDGSFNTLATVLSLAGKAYCDYFAAKLLNSVEQQRNVSFNQFAGDFFAFIFYPIGIWWLQPRINRIFGRPEEEAYDPDTPLDHRVTN